MRDDAGEFRIAVDKFVEPIAQPVPKRAWAGLRPMLGCSGTKYGKVAE
jgi:hypothetical protein